MVIPECPTPLLGRDILTKLKARIHFEEGGIMVTDNEGRPLSGPRVTQVLTLTQADEYRLYQPTKSRGDSIDQWLREFPMAWAETGGTGWAKHRPPLYIELKPGAEPARVRQYPMSREAKAGITPHIRRLLDSGILRKCQSAWNTPLLPVKKPGGKDYRPVQDLREVNARTLDIHPTVPNPYTLLSSLSPTLSWYTVLDLKDAFFSLAVATRCQEIFAFEWQDEERGVYGQLTWTRLPQGFKNSPTLFNEALQDDLKSAAPEHDCLEILAETQMARRDLKDRPLPNSDLIWFTDGSSFVREGHRYAGAAIVDNQGKLIWAACLPQETSAQKAELIALTEALRRAQGKRLTVYTDSRYAFGTVHINGTLYRERGFITAEGKEIKHKPEILHLLEAILLPKAVAVVHTPGHQSGNSLEAKGNRQADAEAKKAAYEGMPLSVLHTGPGLPPPGMVQIPPVPTYTETDKAWAEEQKNTHQGEDGWIWDKEHRMIMPEALGRRHINLDTPLPRKTSQQERPRTVPEPVESDGGPREPTEGQADSSSSSATRSQLSPIPLGLLLILSRLRLGAVAPGDWTSLQKCMQGLFYISLRAFC
ncbi:uncharacterized protein LOC142870063 isoform X3 [Microcebus murinus]|uniref:uncharacterized protein LOC142870063 isoform X3 n=1 Tax=Microcebus murinus TaxID=30608 RepID=UPI003F6DA447